MDDNTKSPEDDVNLQESDQMQFDFIQHFRSIGNSILSLFKSSNNSDDADFDGDNDTSIQIEIAEDPKTSIVQ